MSTKRRQCRRSCQPDDTLFITNVHETQLSNIDEKVTRLTQFIQYSHLVATHGSRIVQDLYNLRIQYKQLMEMHHRSSSNSSSNSSTNARAQQEHNATKEHQVAQLDALNQSIAVQEMHLFQMLQRLHQLLQNHDTLPSQSSVSTPAHEHTTAHAHASAHEHASAHAHATLSNKRQSPLSSPSPSHSPSPSLASHRSQHSPLRTCTLKSTPHSGSHRDNLSNVAVALSQTQVCSQNSSRSSSRGKNDSQSQPTTPLEFLLSPLAAHEEIPRSLSQGNKDRFSHGYPDDSLLDSQRSLQWSSDADNVDRIIPPGSHLHKLTAASSLSSLSSSPSTHSVHSCTQYGQRSDEPFHESFVDDAAPLSPVIQSDVCSRSRSSSSSNRSSSSSRSRSSSSRSSQTKRNKTHKRPRTSPLSSSTFKNRESHSPFPLQQQQQLQLQPHCRQQTPPPPFSTSSNRSNDTSSDSSIILVRKHKHARKRVPNTYNDDISPV
jgi:hypothetical protein